MTPCKICGKPGEYLDLIVPIQAGGVLGMSNLRHLCLSCKLSIRESKAKLLGELVIASGYFDPPHSAHLRYLREAKELGDFLLVVVNNCHQALLKKGRSFLPEKERLALVSEFRCVDRAVLSVDITRSVGDDLRIYHPDIFANGGDATEGVCRENEVCRELDIRQEWAVGGSVKTQSSSDLLENYFKWRVKNENDFRSDGSQGNRKNS